MVFTREQILELYGSEAGKHGEAGTSTIQDIRTRELEVAALFSYLKDGLKVLEIGCGGGYVAELAVKTFALDLTATDFSPAMIALARQRGLEGCRGKVQFVQADVLQLNSDNEYDLIFTERCIQNLTSWDEQAQALSNIARALKSGAEFIMLESFWTGLNKLNEARRELDLSEIPQSWHNLYFDEDKTKARMMSAGCEYVDQNRFLSGYYFGSRVLLPALTPKGKTITSASALNDYFCGLPPNGDFSPMKILRFRRT